MEKKDYEVFLRQSKHYKEFYNQVIEDYRNLLAISEEKAKEFAIHIIAQRAQLQSGIDNQLVNYENDAENDAKMQMDAESLALVDIDFVAISKMEKVADTTRQLNNIKAMLKNQKPSLQPANQASLNEFFGKSTEQTASVEDVANQESKKMVFATQPRFIEQDKERQIQKLTRYIVKDMTEQLFRINLELFETANKQANAIYSNKRSSIKDVKADDRFIAFTSHLKKKNTYANLVTIFAGLVNNRVRKNTQLLIEDVNEQARDVAGKFNKMPTLEEIDVMLAKKMLAFVDNLVDQVLEDAEKHPEAFANTKTMVSFLNAWFRDVNDGTLLPKTEKKFGNQINRYVDEMSLRLFDYAVAYSTDNPKKTDLQNDLGLEL